VYRVREKRDGSFVVSLCHGGGVWHYPIAVRTTDYGNKLRIKNGPAFDNLMDVCVVLLSRAIPNILFVVYSARIVGRIVYSYSAE